MFGMQILGDNNDNIVDSLTPVYIIDFFPIQQNTTGQKQYDFDDVLYKLNWASSFGNSFSNATLNVSINNKTIQWSCSGYSFDIFIFLEVI